MSAKVVFLRRTAKEKAVFGGEVYFDIDGKNEGVLSEKDCSIELSDGEHTLKMYKSHTYDTFIGTAEAQITVHSGNNLLVKYAPPMVISQPGNIVVTDYLSQEDAEKVASERTKRIAQDEEADAANIQKQKEIEKHSNTIWIVLIFVSAIIDALIISSYKF